MANDPTKRLAQLRAFVEQDPADSFSRFALGLEYRKLGQDQDALDTWNALRAADPRYVGLYYHLGALLAELGKPEQAADAYRTGIEVALQAGDHHARNELAAALLALTGGEEDA